MKKTGIYEIKSVDKFRTSLQDPLEKDTIIISKCDCDNEVDYADKVDGKHYKPIAYWIKGLRTYELKFINNGILEIEYNEDLLKTIKKAQLTLDEFNEINNICKGGERKWNIL